MTPIARTAFGIAAHPSGRRSFARRTLPVWLALVVSIGSAIPPATPRPIPLLPEIPAARAGTPCSNFAGDYPLFTGFLSNSSAVPLSETTSGDVYGRIDNVDDTWDSTDCHPYRYDAVIWATDDSSTNLRVDWGKLSGGDPCLYLIGTTDYLHANGGACPGSPTTNRLEILLQPQAVYRNAISLDDTGDYAFAHTDCWFEYANEVIATGATTSVTTGKPGANCGNKALDATGYSQ